MTCTDNCGYYWKEEDDAFPRCHFEGPDGWAPCEQEDEYYDDEAENDSIYYDVEVEYE